MDEQAHWDWRRRSVAEVVWPSFVAAGVGALLFFALIDPNLLGQALEVDFEGGAMAFYSLGFLFFWVLCAASSLLTAWLIRTERRRDEFPDPPEG